MFLPLVALVVTLDQTTVQIPAQPVRVAQAPATPPKPYGDATAAERIAAAIEAANVDDIRVLIVWGSNSDPGALKFDPLWRDPKVVATRFSSDEYKMVKVDIGDGKNADVAAKYGVKIVPTALPMFTVLDQKGRAIAQASAAEFDFDPTKLAAFLVKNQAPAPDAIAPFEAAVKQAKRDGKTVFVWFSAPW